MSILRMVAASALHQPATRPGLGASPPISRSLEAPVPALSWDPNFPPSSGPRRPMIGTDEVGRVAQLGFRRASCCGMYMAVTPPPGAQLKAILFARFLITCCWQLYMSLAARVRAFQASSGRPWHPLAGPGQKPRQVEVLLSNSSALATSLYAQKKSRTGRA